MTRYYSAADTAKLVRQALKAAFPGVTFSVRSHNYSMGSNVTVTWTDGPATKAVQRITSQFTSMGTNDGTDYYPTIERTVNSESVVFSDTRCQHHYSDETINRIARRIATKYGIDPIPTIGKYGWENDVHMGHAWFSGLVWQECERTHFVSKAELAGYVAPAPPAHPKSREY